MQVPPRTRPRAASVASVQELDQAPRCAEQCGTPRKKGLTLNSVFLLPYAPWQGVRSVEARRAAVRSPRSGAPGRFLSSQGTMISRLRGFKAVK
jgi:hypothetical protein